MLESDLDATQRAVMSAIVSHSSEKNGRRVWPGIERLCWLSKLSETAVKKAIRELQKIGVLEKVGDEGEIGVPGASRGRHSLVAFDVWAEMLPQREPWRPGSIFRSQKGGARKPLQAPLFNRSEGGTSRPEGGARNPERGHVAPTEGGTSRPLEEDRTGKVFGSYVPEEEQPALRAGAHSPRETSTTQTPPTSPLPRRARALDDPDVARRIKADLEAARRQVFATPTPPRRGRVAGLRR